MDQYGDTYKANGIGLETLQRFERILLKSTDLLDLVYGTNGETPVSDADLTSHLENQMYKLAYYSIPLYNSSTYAFADDDQKDTMLRLAQAAADSYNASAPADAVRQFTAFHEVSSAALCRHLRRAGLHRPHRRHRFPADRAAEQQHPRLGVLHRRLCRHHPQPVLRSGRRPCSILPLHDAGRPSRPLDGAALDDVRAQVLADMKSDELQDALAAYGASMEHSLDSSAMGKLPARKIAAASSN